MSLLGNLFSKENKKALDQGLEKTKAGFFSRIGRLLTSKSAVDDAVLDDLEEALIGADVGVDTTLKIIERIRLRVARDKYTTTEELNRLLREEVGTMLEEGEAGKTDFEIPPGIKPYVIMVVGVNGAGKTTTIGKLAAQLKKRGKSVLLGAGDTFRAAAVEQLKRWGQKVDVPVVARAMNTDPSAVAFEAVEEGVKQQVDVVIVDTAGRLHTKVNLMAELSKIRRVMQKVVDGAPHEVLLVIDGSTGQNALIQAREFTKATEVTALAITKLDGTARGGVVIGIAEEFRIPVKYIGVGEKEDDLQVFNKKEFVNSLFSRD